MSYYPAITEGANLTNLLQQLGIPYLSVHPEGHTPLPDFDHIGGPDEYRALEKMHHASRSLASLNPDDALPVQEFIEESCRMTSGYQELTQRLQREATSPFCDQVLYSLVAFAIAEGLASPELL